MSKISIIIPAYNEAKNIPLVISKANSIIKKKNLDAEIFLVNDGSTDNTMEVCNHLKREYKNFYFYNHKTNLGLTAALNTCFKKSKGDILIFLPADMQSNPEEDVPKLLSKMNEGYDMVLGWKQNRRGTKILASKVYNLLSRLLFKINLHDLNWIKAFDRKIIKDVNLRSDWHRYLAVIAHSKGYKIGEVKVNVYKRKYGKSKFGVKRLLIGFLDLFVVKFNLSFSERPMLIFGSVGIILFFLGFIGGVYLTYIKLTIGVIGDRIPFIFLVMLLVILGIQFFALGFLSELLVNINESLKRMK